MGMEKRGGGAKESGGMKGGEVGGEGIRRQEGEI